MHAVHDGASSLTSRHAPVKPSRMVLSELAMDDYLFEVLDVDMYLRSGNFKTISNLQNKVIHISTLLG